MTNPYGRAMAQMARVFAELERAMIRERTRDRRLDRWRSATTRVSLSRGVSSCPTSMLSRSGSVVFLRAERIRFRYHLVVISMVCNSSQTNRLLHRLRSQDAPALAELLGRHRERLRKMVRLRLDRRLRGRVRSADVLQDVDRHAARRIGEYLA